MSVYQVVNILMIRVAVSTQYQSMTDGLTNGQILHISIAF